MHKTPVMVFVMPIYVCTNYTCDLAIEDFKNLQSIARNALTAVILIYSFLAQISDSASKEKPDLNNTLVLQKSMER